MVGRLAVAAAAASLPERDGDVQPRKKRREEDVKTITRYFSPLAKAGGKASSPPKASNILDYFKKTPAAEKAPAVAGGITAEFGDEQDCYIAPSKLKRKRKRAHLNNKRREMKESEDECLIEINCDDSVGATRLKEDSDDFIAACALGAQKSGGELAEGNKQGENSSHVDIYVKSDNVGPEINATKKRIRKTRKRKNKVKVDSSGSFSFENQLNEKCRKETKDKKKKVSPEVAECVAVISDSSFEVHTDKTSRANDSIVTVSFEDFLKSQGENYVEDVKEGTKPMLDNSVTVNEMDQSGSTGDPEKCEESQQLPLRTVTVLAQVHSIPPKSTSLCNEQKGSTKIASIFLKQKVFVEEESSPPLQESEQTEQVTQKRKSNVVIEEEELELAILETAGSDSLKMKSTLEERHQFMKAFRQPTSDVRKSGVKRTPGKAKQVIGKSSKDKKGPKGDNVLNMVLEGGLPEDDVDKCMHSSPENTRSKNKRPKKFQKFQKRGSKRNKVLGAKEKCVSSTSNYSEDKESVGNDQMKESNLDVRISSSPKVNELRRSLRKKKTDTSKTITPQKNRSTYSEDDSVWPVQTSTPKASRQYLKKSSVYKAEVITVPSDENSPIRMRFTRINATIKSNKGEAMNNEELNSKNIKISSTSKNISKAKQLVEKAKAIRHNRSKVNEDSPAPVRRSSRQQALAERKTLQENEKSVIILDSSQSNDSSAMQDVKQKNLRSLNDVLGKSKNLKVSKNSKGKLGYVPSFLGRNARKPTDEPVVIFDDSSQDASENSQDDDQFRAKREFLMSGLPELLKRQIAKKAAAMEAYFLASSYFKTVVHVQQKDDFCPMWKLKSPLCPLLTKLRKLSTEVTNVTKTAISLGEFSTVKSELTGSSSAPVFSGHRPVFSEVFRKGLLEEIVSSNSQFPVRKYFYKFLKKQTERLLLENSMQGSRDASSNSEVNEKPSDNWKETKRKRKEKEDQKSKRRKQTENKETELESRVSRSVITPVPGGKQADAEQATQLERNKNRTADVRTEDTEYLSETNALPGVEDVLWTEKYQPQDSSELVGNKKEIERLHSWLKEWKKRADWEEKRNQKGEKEDKEHQDSLDSLDFKDDKSDIEEENNLCNTVLITGPPGVGKTAAVYACAQELGFKIFEVNASCQRSGRQILSQLKEATQSHQVDKKGINAHKPCFFNSCSSTKSPKKMYSPKKVISPRKPPLSPKGAGLKRSLPPKTLANYFKMPSRCKGNDGTVTAQEKNKGNAQNLCEEKNVQIKSKSKEVEDGEHNRKSATSLILFEEVDIIFDEDAGFLSAIKTFMATAKRPVILTTSDPTFSLMFDGYFEEINFRTPSLMNAASYLQVLCLAENLRTDVKDLAALLTTNNCDIRQSVLYLQFWVKSGGGYLKDKHLVLHGEDETNPADQAINSEKTTDPKFDFSHDAPPQEFPKCDTGCVETLLGLKNILLPSEDLFTFLKQKITTKENWDKLIQLLTEFQLKKVDFIYSNLEFLLPLPVNYLSNQTEASNPIPERTTIVSSKNSSINSYCYGISNSGKKSKKTKNKKRLEELDDSDLFDTGLNYSAEFITLPSDGPPPCAEVNEEESKLMNNKKGKETKSKTPSNDRRSAVVVQCLNSLTEFVEDMSFLDCCVNSTAKEPLEFSKGEGFNWMNGKIKNGLCDEFSIENTDWWSYQSCSEIKAAIEALSFNKCSVSISQNLEASLSTSNTPESDQLEGLTLHMSETRNSVSFNQSADISIHKKAQKRLAVIRTVFSRTPLNLGNKQASILEYLPTLRSICRSEKSYAAVVRNLSSVSSGLRTSVSSGAEARAPTAVVQKKTAVQKGWGTAHFSLSTSPIWAP